MSNPIFDMIQRAITPSALPPISPLARNNPMQQQDPWQQFQNMAVQEGNKQQPPFPPAVINGQAALESARGTSDFARNRNNYFGYQAYDSNPDAAASFSSPKQSIDAYLQLVGNYPGVKEAAATGDPDKVIKAIEANGYASDPDYVSKVESMPEYQKYANYKAPQNPILNMMRGGK
jgi:flagellum-specific peptidoglycan hydrolase FlgJ